MFIAASFPVVARILAIAAARQNGVRISAHPQGTAAAVGGSVNAKALAAYRAEDSRAVTAAVPPLT
jgi:hypothetical protein